MDTIDKIFVGFLVLLVVIGVPAGIYDIGYAQPQAAQNALYQCQMRGYTSYVGFERTLLSNKAIAVRCEHPIENNNINLKLVE